MKKKANSYAAPIGYSYFHTPPSALQAPQPPPLSAKRKSVRSVFFNHGLFGLTRISINSIIAASLSGSYLSARLRRPLTEPSRCLRHCRFALRLSLYVATGFADSQRKSSRCLRHCRFALAASFSQSAPGAATDLTVNVSFALFICMAGHSAKGVTFCYPLVFYRIIRSQTGVANHDGGFVLGIPLSRHPTTCLPPGLPAMG